MNLKNLYNSTIISCGVGEDISFDIEMMNKFNSRIIFVDPTPRAIKYYDQIIKNIGKKKQKIIQMMEINLLRLTTYQILK